MGMKHICSKSSLYTGFELLPGARSLLAETAGIKQNQTENAKPSQFSRAFSELPGSLRRENRDQETCKKPWKFNVSGFFSCPKIIAWILWFITDSDRFQLSCYNVKVLPKDTQIQGAFRRFLLGSEGGTRRYSFALFEPIAAIIFS